MVANLTGSKFSLTMVTMSATSALNWMMVNLRPDTDAHFQTNYYYLITILNLFAVLKIHPVVILIVSFQKSPIQI